MREQRYEIKLFEVSKISHDAVKKSIAEQRVQAMQPPKPLQSEYITAKGVDAALKAAKELIKKKGRGLRCLSMTANRWIAAYVYPVEL